MSGPYHQRCWCNWSGVRYCCSLKAPWMTVKVNRSREPVAYTNNHDLSPRAEKVYHVSVRIRFRCKVIVHNITTTQTRKGFISCSPKSSVIVGSGLDWPPSCQRLRRHYPVGPPCKVFIPKLIQDSYSSSSHRLYIPPSKKEDREEEEQRPPAL